jgi:hypothetical protein
VQQREGSSQIVHIAKTITLRGGYSAADGFSEPPQPHVRRTVLDAHRDGRVVVIDHAGPVLEGLVITGAGGYYSGGGIHVAGAWATIDNCEIVDNVAEGDGGGVFVNRGSVQILGCDISANQATWGGGLRIINDADATIVGNRIVENVAQISSGGIDIECCGGTTPFVARNLIVDNQGGARGGGVGVQTTNAQLVNNIIARNEASQGAAIWLAGMASHPASVQIAHNTLAHAPFADCIGTGDHVAAELTNNIIAGFATGINNTSPPDTAVDAQTTLFHGNATDYTAGVSSVAEAWGDPVFVDACAGDYHIGPGSAAIDRGQDAGLTKDFDNQLRPVGAAPDIGADEYWPSVYLPLAVCRG